MENASSNNGVLDYLKSDNHVVDRLRIAKDGDDRTSDALETCFRRKNTVLLN